MKKKVDSCTELKMESNVSRKYSTNITLVGRDYLDVTVNRITSETVNEIDVSTNTVVTQVSKSEKKEIISQKRFQLKEVSVEELRLIRKARIPSFVLKENIDGIEHYWFAKIDAELSFLSANILGRHQCSLAPNCCDRLSPASDEDGGCAKVRHMARFIELYPWITHGYETFNTKCDTFMVATCEHYTPYARRPKDTK